MNARTLIKAVEAIMKESDSAEVRVIGLCQGKFIVPDDFDSPLPDVVLDAFDGILNADSPQNMLNFLEKP